MCNCKTELEAKLLERAKEQLPDSKNHSVEITGYVFAMGPNEITLRQALPVIIKHTVTVKKTGEQKEKKIVSNVLARFCMFCGEKHVKDEPEAA